MCTKINLLLLNYLFFFIMSHFDYFTDWTEILRNPWPLLWKVLIIATTSNACQKQLPSTFLPSFLNTLCITYSLSNTMNLLQYCEVHLCHPNKIFPGHFFFLLETPFARYALVMQIIFWMSLQSLKCVSFCSSTFKHWKSSISHYHYCLIFSNK